MKHIIITISFLFCITLINAQSIVIKKSEVIEKIDGYNYYVHTIEQSHTLYSISKAYNTTVDEIKSINGIESNLNLGQKIWIPVPEKQETPPQTPSQPTPQSISPEVQNNNNTNKPEAKVVKITKDSNYIYHNVKRQETLYRLSKKYFVSIDEIKKHNPHIEETINEGEILKIPINDKQKQTKGLGFFKNSKKNKEPSIIIIDSTLTIIKDTTYTYPCDSPSLENLYKIAVMLPLHLNYVDSIDVDYMTSIKTLSFYKSFTFIHFYEGLCMAFDSLREQGFPIELFVYDIPNDSILRNDVLQRPELKDMHLIIGPLYSRNLIHTANFAKEYNIKVISPLSYNNIILRNNPNVFKIHPSMETQLYKITQFITDSFSSDNVLIIYDNINKGGKILNTLTEQIQFFHPPDSSIHDSDYVSPYRFIEYHSNMDIDSLSDIFFSDSLNNVIFTISKNEAYVADFVRKLNKLASKEKLDFTLFGLPNWKNFENIEIEYLQKLNLHLFTTSFIDYSEKNINQFILRFRDKYYCEPSSYAFQGFDTGYYFIKALNQYGKNFDKCINDINLKGLQNNYHFRKEGNFGFENSNLHIYKYENYKLIKVN